MRYMDRFDGKGELYAKARPNYAAALFEYLKADPVLHTGSVFADVGVMVLAVLNATRALYTKDLAKKNEA